jgi:hypothetical protein
MELLSYSVHSLSPDEIKLLKKRIGAGSKKLELVKAIQKGSTRSNEDAIKVLGYKDKSAFYTLKHRLTDDIIQLKLELGKNKVIETREQIDNLRTLLYSKSSTLLIKSLHTMEKRAKELDLYRSMEELYLCYKLVFFYNRKKREAYENKYLKARENASAFSRLEELFFDTVFSSPDLFYHYSESSFNQLRDMFREMEVIHYRLNSKVSEFLTLSAKLTIYLNPHNKQDLTVYQDDLNKLYKLYITTPLQFRYPDCRFAIYALFNKFHYLTGQTKQFEESLMQLNNHVESIKGYRMYENAYYYYLFINSKHLIDNKLYLGAATFIKEHIDERLLPISSRKLVCYYHYILSIANVLENDMENAQSNLLLCRNYSAYLDKENNWVALDEAAISVMLQLIEGNQDRLAYESNRFRKLLRKTQMNNHRFWVFFNDWLHLNKRGDKEKALVKARELEKLSEQHMKLFLLPFSHIQSNLINKEKTAEYQNT